MAYRFCRIMAHRAKCQRQKYVSHIHLSLVFFLFSCSVDRILQVEYTYRPKLHTLQRDLLRPCRVPKWMSSFSHWHRELLVSLVALSREKKDKRKLLPFLSSSALKEVSPVSPKARNCQRRN